MFKFYNQYKSFEEWFTAFSKPYKGYKRTFNICDYSKKLTELKHIVPLSYQPLQSIKLNDKQITSLCAQSVQAITKISKNVDEFIKYRGIEDGKDIPEYYKMLEIDKSMFYDKYIQKKICEDIDGIKNRAYLGGVNVEGNYQVLGIDCVLLAEHMFNLPVKGVIPANTIYCRYWYDRCVSEVAIIRFPHISHEYKISNVVDIASSENVDIKYMRFQNATVCISGFDSTDIRLQGSDHDNDAVVSTNSRILIQASKAMTNFKNTIIHVESFKAKKNKTDLYSIDDIGVFDTLIVVQ